MEHLNKETWVLPTMATRLIDNLVLKGGETQETIKTKREFAKTREAWIAAIFLLGKMSEDGKIWYLRGNEVEDSSYDMFARCIWLDNKTIYSGEILSIQVVRKTEYNDKGVISAIEKKLKDDLNGVSLVCYAMTDELVNWELISRKVAEFKPQTRDITIIGNVGERKFIVGRVHPDIKVVEINLDVININAPKIIEATEVHKPEETGITKQGVALLTPTFKVKKAYRW